MPRPKIICRSALLLYVDVSYDNPAYSVERRAALMRDNFTCQYCDESSEVWTVDHVIPRSRGGSNNRQNLVCACPECNGLKGRRTPLEWYIALQSSTPELPTRPYLERILSNLENRFNVTAMMPPRRPKRWYDDLIFPRPAAANGLALEI
jgi:hypothetical protein